MSNPYESPNSEANSDLPEWVLSIKNSVFGCSAIFMEIGAILVIFLGIGISALLKHNGDPSENIISDFLYLTAVMVQFCILVAGIIGYKRRVESNAIAQVGILLSIVGLLLGITLICLGHVKVILT